MHRLGIHSGADLMEKSLAFLTENFGKSGPYFYGIARGIDHRQVKPDRVRKSIGSEDTFAQDIAQLEPAKAEIATLVAKIWAYCGVRNMTAKTVTVKVKYSDFQQITRSRTQSQCFTSEAELLEISEALLETVYPFRKGVRLLGVTLSSLSEEEAQPSAQLPLFM